ncbi:hypothetical protein [Candidatus Albibeggiatoa sp. nov. BB20]|uniref:hypothetical protein n=1 Tax=Candidatus Albibeggiatoa sp. nov. BB20 TaxID=3162723 RepID=UPI003365AF70
MNQVGTQENLEQIRSLLFGQYVNQYDSHLGQLDSQYVDLNAALQQEINKVEQQFNSELQAIKQQLTQEVAQLNKQFSTEQQNNQTQHTDLQTAVGNLEQQFEQKLNQASAKFTHEQKQLRDILKDFIQQVRQQNEKNSRLFTELKLEIDGLRANKLNRKDLAGIFSELVPRLSSQLTGITEDD